MYSIYIERECGRFLLCRFVEGCFPTEILQRYHDINGKEMNLSNPRRQLWSLQFQQTTDLHVEPCEIKTGNSSSLIIFITKDQIRKQAAEKGKCIVSADHKKTNETD